MVLLSRAVFGVIVLSEKYLSLKKDELAANFLKHQVDGIHASLTDMPKTELKSKRQLEKDAKGVFKALRAYMGDKDVPKEDPQQLVAEVTMVHHSSFFFFWRISSFFCVSSDSFYRLWSILFSSKIVFVKNVRKLVTHFSVSNLQDPPAKRQRVGGTDR